MNRSLQSRVRSGLILLFTLLIGGCFTEDAANIEIRNGLAYKKGTKTTYSGKYVEYFPTKQGENQRLFREGRYEMGRKHGNWVVHKWNRAKTSYWYEYGKLDGKVTTYSPRGVKREVKRYENGLLDGASSKFDHGGNVVRTVYYKKGKLSAPPRDETGDIRRQLEKAFGMFRGHKPNIGSGSTSKKPDKQGGFSTWLEGLF